MTVKELIARLAVCSSDAEVFANVSYDNQFSLNDVIVIDVYVAPSGKVIPKQRRNNPVLCALYPIATQQVILR